MIEKKIMLKLFIFEKNHKLRLKIYFTFLYVLNLFADKYEKNL